MLYSKIFLIFFFTLLNANFAYSQDIVQKAENELSDAFNHGLDGTDVKWEQLFEAFEFYLKNVGILTANKSVEKAYLDFIESRQNRELLPKIPNKSALSDLLNQAKISYEYFTKNKEMRAFERLSYPVAKKYEALLKDGEKIKDLLSMGSTLHDISLEFQGETLSPTLLAGAMKSFITEIEIEKTIYKQAVILLFFTDVVHLDNLVYGK